MPKHNLSNCNSLRQNHEERIEIQAQRKETKKETNRIIAANELRRSQFFSFSPSHLKRLTVMLRPKVICQRVQRHRITVNFQSLF